MPGQKGSQLNIELCRDYQCCSYPSVDLMEWLYVNCTLLSWFGLEFGYFLLYISNSLPHMYMFMIWSEIWYGMFLFCFGMWNNLLSNSSLVSVPDFVHLCFISLCHGFGFGFPLPVS